MTSPAFSSRIIRPRSAIAAILVLLAAVPAQAQSRAEQLLSDRPPPRRGCAVSTTPAPLPTVSQLADSTALAAAVAAFAERNPISGGRMFGLYSIAFNAQGAVERVKDIEYLLPQGKADEFTALLRGHIRPQAAGKSRSVRLRIEAGANPVFRVGRSEICPPSSGTRVRIRSPSLGGGVEVTSVRFRAVVNADGSVDDVHLFRGTGNDDFDRMVRDMLREVQYNPGLVDGVPVEMELEETLRFETRGG